MSLKPIPKQIRELRSLTKFQKEVIITEEERDLINTRRAAIQTDRDIIRKKSDLKNAVESVLRSERLVSTIQYVSVDSRETMKPISEVGKDGGVISLACMVGSVRLIDCIII